MSAFADLVALLSLLGVFLLLFIITLLARAHGAADSDLNMLRNLDTALGVGLLTYIGWVFVRLMGGGDGKNKP